MINLNIELVCLVKVDSNVQVLYFKNVIIFRKLQKKFSIRDIRSLHVPKHNMFVYISSVFLYLWVEMLLIVGELKFAAWVKQSPHFL